MNLNFVAHWWSGRISSLHKAQSDTFLLDPPTAAPLFPRKNCCVFVLLKPKTVKFAESKWTVVYSYVVTPLTGYITRSLLYLLLLALCRLDHVNAKQTTFHFFWTFSVRLQLLFSLNHSHAWLQVSYSLSCYKTQTTEPEKLNVFTQFQAKV